MDKRFPNTTIAQLRLPAELCAKLDVVAKKERRSRHAQILVILEGYLQAQEHPFDRVYSGGYVLTDGETAKFPDNLTSDPATREQLLRDYGHNVSDASAVSSPPKMRQGSPDGNILTARHTIDA